MISLDAGFSGFSPSSLLECCLLGQQESGLLRWRALLDNERGGRSFGVPMVDDPRLFGGAREIRSRVYMDGTVKWKERK
jgi:hypothetical protein